MLCRCVHVKMNVCLCRCVHERPMGTCVGKCINMWVLVLFCFARINGILILENIQSSGDWGAWPGDTSLGRAAAATACTTGARLARDWHVTGTWLALSWHVNGKCLASGWQVKGTCLHVFGKCLASGWHVIVKCCHVTATLQTRDRYVADTRFTSDKQVAGTWLTCRWHVVDAANANVTLLFLGGRG